MPIGMLNPNAGMLAQNYYGLTGSGILNGSIDGRNVLQMYSPVSAAQAAYTSGIGEGAQEHAAQGPGFNTAIEGVFDQSFADRQGFGDLWRTGYTPGGGSGEERTDSVYSPELLDRLSQYQVARLGFGDDMRQFAIMGQDGNVVGATQPRAYNDAFRQSLIAMAALAGGAALNGAFAGAGEGAIGAGVEGGALGATGGSPLAAANASSLTGTAGLGEAAGAAAGGFGGGGILNPALIESAVGTAGYGASSAGAGGGAGMLAGAGALNPALIESAVGTSGYGASSAGAGGGAGTLAGGGLLGSLGNLGEMGSGAMQWLRDNPTIGRLLFSAGSGLLSAAGNSGGSGGSQAPAGPPRQWSSPIQQGLMTPPELTNVATPVSFGGRW